MRRPLSLTTFCRYEIIWQRFIDIGRCESTKSFNQVHNDLLRNSIRDHFLMTLTSLGEFNLLKSGLPFWLSPNVLLWL